MSWTQTFTWHKGVWPRGAGVAVVETPLAHKAA